MNILYKSSEAITLLDMLTSLAACNISSDYGKAVFELCIYIQQQHELMKFVSLGALPHTL